MRSERESKGKSHRTLQVMRTSALRLRHTHCRVVSRAVMGFDARGKWSW